MSLDIKIERLLDTTADVAFERWAGAEFMSRWYAPQDDWTADAHSDVREGGAWGVAFGPAGGDEVWREHGVFSVVEPPSRLVYTSVFTFPDGRSFETLVTVTFEERDGKTLLTLLDAGYPNDEQRDAHAGGWPSFLDAFERVLAP